MNTDLPALPEPSLLPCPFCGHTTPYFERMGTPRQSCIVACGDCGARHESSDEGTRSGSSWNTRAALAAQQPAVPAGWGLETGTGGFGDKGNRWVCVRHLESQCWQDFYEHRDPTIFGFLSALAAAPAVQPELTGEDTAEHVAYRRGFQHGGDMARAAAQQPARGREADRARFPDPAFNEWLDTTVTENGEFTVWHLLASTGDALAGWENRPHYVKEQPAEAVAPLGYISPKQVPRIADPDDESGVYIPMRKTAKGNFTLAVFAAAPSAQPVAVFHAHPEDWQYSITLLPGVPMLRNGTLLAAAPPAQQPTKGDAA